MRLDVFLSLTIGVSSLTVLSLGSSASSNPSDSDSKPRRKIDPAAWGGDHVGKPPPPFITGDECLFCHRMDIGPTWPKNRHFLTMRRADAKSIALAALRKHKPMKRFAEEVDFVLGGDRQMRFLKRTKDYGRLAMLSIAWKPSRDGRSGQLTRAGDPHWDDGAFGKSCAGCHASGVDSKSFAFTAVSLDCFTCHGDIKLEHTKNASLALLSKKANASARVVISICGQCHIRTGKSRSSGLSYPNNFVAGDNLFRDFHVDWSNQRLRSLDPTERHILENTRDVALFGRNQVTCLTCHAVHTQSTAKHQQLKDQALCLNCHNAAGPKSTVKSRGRHSRLCGY